MLQCWLQMIGAGCNGDRRDLPRVRHLSFRRWWLNRALTGRSDACRCARSILRCRRSWFRIRRRVGRGRGWTGGKVGAGWIRDRRYRRGCRHLVFLAASGLACCRLDAAGQQHRLGPFRVTLIGLDIKSGQNASGVSACEFKLQSSIAVIAPNSMCTSTVFS